MERSGSFSPLWVKHSVPTARVKLSKVTAAAAAAAPDLWRERLDLSAHHEDSQSVFGTFVKRKGAQALIRGTQAAALRVLDTVGALTVPLPFK